MINVSLQKPDQPDYVERTDKTARKAMAQLIAEGIEKFDSGIKRVNAAGRELVFGVNDIRAAGVKLKAAEELNQYEFKNWHHNLQDWKAAQIEQVKIKTAKAVLAVMPEPGKNLDDCKRALQLVFIAAGQMHRATRIGPQTSHEPANIWNDLVDTGSSYMNILNEFKQKEPLNTWPPDRLEKFLLETEPIEQDRKVAMELLKEGEHT